MATPDIIRRGQSKILRILCGRQESNEKIRFAPHVEPWAINNKAMSEAIMTGAPISIQHGVPYRSAGSKFPCDFFRTGRGYENERKPNTP